MDILDIQLRLSVLGVGTHFDLRYLFQVNSKPSEPVHLVMEAPEQFTAVFNDRPVAMQASGWWVDPSFQKVDVSPTSKPAATSCW